MEEVTAVTRSLSAVNINAIAFWGDQSSRSIVGRNNLGDRIVRQSQNNKRCQGKGDRDGFKKAVKLHD